MSNKTDKGRRLFSGGSMDRRDFLKLGGYVSGAALLTTTGMGRSFAATGGDRTLTIGNIGWDEDVALAYLSKVILEQELGYRQVRIEKRSVKALFQGVADGSLDTFQDVWLPRTHRSYWQRYGDKLVKLDSWYRGFATLGLTVPDYVEARSIADLPAYRGRFGGRIIGIEPGAGEMQIVRNKVIPGYGLGDYKLIASSTPHMLDELARALKHEKPIVVTLYKPHWAFSAYRIRYLEDPKGLISGHDERLYTVVRRGLKHDKPDAYAFLNAISLTPDELGQLELAINGAKSPEAGVENWLSGNSPFGGEQNSLNRQLVQPWIDAAKRARSQA